MRLTPTPVEINESEGFTTEKDIFQRKSFAEELSNLLENVDDELVVALDAPWGEGKTTFVKMWQGMLSEERGNKVVYFDAFKNDYLEDPFLALVGEVYKLLNDDEGNTKSEFKTKAVSAIKTIGKASIGIGLRALTAGVVDETVLEGAGAGEKVSELSENYIASRLDSLEEDKASIESFKNELISVAAKVSNGKKIVFIIDELDRCNPSFALDLLEKIKHIFSIPGIAFVLVMNREQMGGIISSRYGARINSAKYLQKFIHIWTGLPKSADEYRSTGKTYLSNCLSRMEFELKSDNQKQAIDLYGQLIDYYQMSLRDIERSLTNFSIIINLNDNLNIDYLELSVYISIIKVLYPTTYKKLVLSSISYSEVIEATELQKLKIDYWKDLPEGHPLKWKLKYYLSDEDECNELLEQGANYSCNSFGIIGRNAIDNICRMLQTFR